MAGTMAIEDIIGIAPLTEALRATTSGIPDPFPEEFKTVKPANKILGNRAKYTRIYGARTTAKLAAYGAPGRRVPLQPISQQPVTMFYLAMEFLIDVNMLARLQAFEQYVQDEGTDWLAYQIMEVSKRMANSRIVSLATQLRYGLTYWDSDGNFLPTSSGAAYQYGASIPANNLNQGNGIISASWALSNTDILGDIRRLQRQSAQDTGLKIDCGMYGLKIPLYMQQNNTLQSYFARNAGFRDTLTDTGDMPANFGGIKRWVNVSHAFFEDVNGNNQLLWNDDLVTFVPDLNQMDKMDWWAMMEGSAAVLRGFDSHVDPMSALTSCPQEYGMSAYSLPTFTPPLGVVAYFQDVFLPCIRNEKAIYPLTVAY